MPMKISTSRQLTITSQPYLPNQVNYQWWKKNINEKLDDVEKMSLVSSSQHGLGWIDNPNEQMLNLHEMLYKL